LTLRVGTSFLPLRGGFKLKAASCSGAGSEWIGGRTRASSGRAPRATHCPILSAVARGSSARMPMALGERVAAAAVFGQPTKCPDDGENRGFGRGPICHFAGRSVWPSACGLNQPVPRFRATFLESHYFTIARKNSESICCITSTLLDDWGHTAYHASSL
jgi:hypothetical protein